MQRWMDTAEQHKFCSGTSSDNDTMDTIWEELYA